MSASAGHYNIHGILAGYGTEQETISAAADISLGRMIGEKHSSRRQVSVMICGMHNVVCERSSRVALCVELQFLK